MEREHGHSQATAQGSLDPTPPGQCSPGSTADTWLQGVGQEETEGRPSQPCGGLSTTTGRAGEKAPHSQESGDSPRVQQVGFSLSFCEICVVRLRLLSQNTNWALRTAQSYGPGPPGAIGISWVPVPGPWGGNGGWQG